jgi:electron transport complex protein RnfG
MFKILKMGAILMLFCAISAGGLAYVYSLTKPQIDLFAKQNFENALLQVLAADNFKQQGEYYIGSRGGKIAGFVFMESIRGYAGPIRLLVGTDLTGRVTGIKILEQKETPGLGINITGDHFLKQFIGKKSEDSIQPKKDIDAVTGATISSRAVCMGVRQALNRLQKEMGLDKNK